jgi:hypothetical protein
MCDRAFFSGSCGCFLDVSSCRRLLLFTSHANSPP